MKKIVLILLIAIISLQLAAAPNDLPQLMTGTLTFGDLSLPTGVVKGYKITMDNSDYITTLGTQSKSVYFTIEAEPKFYKEKANGEIVEFEIPFDAGANIRATVLQGDASEVVINRLPYIFAYGDSVAFDLDIVFGGSMYSVIFGRESSNNAITIDNLHGRAFFMYNDVNGGILLLNDDYTTQLLDVGVVHTLSFRPPSAGAAAGEEEAGANARRIGRAGRVADIETQGCTDMDSAEADQYSASSYGFDETGTVLSDFCATDPVTHRKNLNEVRCNADGNAYLEEHSCAEDCRNGACRPQQAQNEVAFCYDSDLTGQAGLDTNAVNRLVDSFSSKGIVAGFYAAGRDISYGIWDDSCSSSNKLVEYYCRAQKTRFASITCGSGCTEGKCASPPYCFDSDGGENFETKGNVLEIISQRVGADNNLAKNTKTDECLTVNNLKEYSCDNNGLIKDQVKVCDRGCFQGRCIRPTENIERPRACATKSDCTASQACIKAQGEAQGYCSVCTRSQDCGSGYVCESSRCKPASGRCNNDLNCKIGKYCSPRVGQLGFCQNEVISSLDNVRTVLERRWARVNAYARIIMRFEGLHNIELPPKIADGQACFVNAQCISNECDPDTSTCTAPDPNNNAGNRANAGDADANPIPDIPGI